MLNEESEMTNDDVVRVARVICDYYDDLPNVATYLQRKAETREFVDRLNVHATARAAIEAMPLALSDAVDLVAKGMWKVAL